MEEQSAQWAARLRAKAAQCRKMAFGAHSKGVAAELESIAREYETDAENLAAPRLAAPRTSALRHGPGLRDV
jgi:hypothetical protein